MAPSRRQASPAGPPYLLRGACPKAAVCKGLAGVLIAATLLSVSYLAGHTAGLSTKVNLVTQKFKDEASAVWSADLLHEEEADTAVVYIFSNTDPEASNNLDFFLTYGVREKDGAYYYFIVQVGGQAEEFTLDPERLPANARALYHKNECYDWGTFGWALASGAVPQERYAKFVLLNSSVRGPFVPPYVPAGVAWHRLLTGRLDGETKLVGPVISCEGTPFEGNAGGQWRFNPHVQSYTLAMDAEGLAVLQRNGSVLKCWNSRWDAIWYAELGSSAAVLSAGYNIASLLTRYQGVDWRDEATWNCNGRMNPTGELYFDGYTLTPYEVLFVKFKAVLTESLDSITLDAARLGGWMAGLANGTSDIAGNAYVEQPVKVRAPRIAAMKARGSGCFDGEHYRTSNADLGGLPEEELWPHFVQYGQFQGRAFRFTCPWPTLPELAAEAAAAPPRPLRQQHRVAVSARTRYMPGAPARRLTAAPLHAPGRPRARW